MKNAGGALMGIGIASGENRASVAARNAINSPLLDVTITGAKGVLFAVAGNDDMTMLEIQEAAKTITEAVDPNAKVIFGAIRDEKLNKGEIKVTVIASGFPEGENGAPSPLFQDMSQTDTTAPERTEEVAKESPKEKGRIHNTVDLTGRTAGNIPEPKNTEDVAPKQVEKKVPIQDNDDDDWGVVPAFLRRKR